MMIILQQLEGMGEHCKLPHWGFGDQNGIQMVQKSQRWGSLTMAFTGIIYKK